MSTRWWTRITTILGSEDPMTVAWYTGKSYATATRWRSGESGTHGPRAADLEGIATALRERGGINLTIGQIWGSENIPPKLLQAAKLLPPHAGSPGRKANQIPDEMTKSA